MATIDRIRGYRVAIFSNDHRPAHVHVISGDSQVVFELNCDNGPPTLREAYAISKAEVTRLRDELHARLHNACKEWRKIHGAT